MMGKSKMARLLSPLVALALLLALSATAQAEEMMSGLNLRIEAGGGFVTGDPDLSFNGASGELDTGTGYSAGAALWLDGLLFEHLSFGVQYLRMAGNDFDESVSGTGFLQGAVVTVAGDLEIEPTIDAFMVNAALRKNDGSIHPYFGGGVGVARSSADVSFDGTITVNGQVVPLGSDDDSDTTFAGQIFGGVDFDITENIYVGVNGRYFITNADLFGVDVEFRNIVGMGVIGFKL